MSSTTTYRRGARDAGGLFDGIFVDLFAGGGGAGLGIEEGSGRAVDVAINHDRMAVRCYKINHPSAMTLCEDVRKVPPREATGGRHIRLLWASPDCTDFSKAKGGKPVRKKIRGLAWVVVKWARSEHPDMIILENVEEFQDWGPLIHLKIDGKRQYTKHGERVMVRDKTRKGSYFRRWVQCFRDEGYVVEWRELRACDYGGNTTRKRFFLIARRDGQPIVWPAPTHGPKLKRGQKKKAHGGFVLASPPLKPYRTAAECIDWSLPCPSIFMSREESRDFERVTGIRCNRPLAPKTMDRIGMGMWKYVLNNPNPFIVRCAHGGDHFRGQPIDKPLSTLTGSNDYALVEPFLIQRYGEGPHQQTRGQVIDHPLHTITPNNNSGVLVSAFLAKHFGGHTTPGGKLSNPMGAITAKDHHAVVAAYMQKICQNGSNGTRASDIRSPLRMIGNSVPPVLAEVLVRWPRNMCSLVRRAQQTPRERCGKGGGMSANLLKLRHQPLRRPDTEPMMAERIYLEMWREWNRVEPSVNFGLPGLAIILNTKKITLRPPGADYGEDVDPVSCRDARVAATVIEWLGSKEGCLFLGNDLLDSPRIDAEKLGNLT